MLISAPVFAAIHAHIPSLAGLFVLAVALTLVYEGAGSLWAPILMHSLFNGLTVILTLAWPDSDEMKLRDVSEDRLFEILLADLPLGRNTRRGSR